MEMYHDFYLGHEKSVENVVKAWSFFDGYWRKERKFIMKTRKNKKSERMGFTGYTDAPPEIEKEMEDAVLVKDSCHLPKNLC